ncbi:MAG: hypothetical protein H7122_20045 [Chitinophagaceae bacterium]|nr:hypothetical protein [Chitinophagaceae bacterium]
MEDISTNSDTVQFNSRFSFRPLIKAWEETIREGREGTSILYSQLLEKVKQHPELLEPIQDDTILENHRVLIEQMMATVFPVTLSDKEDLFAVTKPFQYKVLYSSRLFRTMFLGDDDFIKMPSEETAQKISSEKLIGAYQLILTKLYNMKIGGVATSVHPFKCPDSGLDKYLELEMDTKFIDVFAKGKLPEMDINCGWGGCNYVSDILNVADIEKHLPLDQFEFEGMVIIRIREVTEREVISNIKNSLLNIHSFADQEIFQELQTEMQNLLGLQGVQTAIKPFFTINNHLVLTELHTTFNADKNQLPSAAKQLQIHKDLIATFKASKRILLLSDISDDTVKQYPFLSVAYHMGWKSAIICPIFIDHHELIGMLLIFSKTTGSLQNEHLIKIDPVIPLFKLALQKSQEQLDHQVDKVIKEQFTAVQDAVEWRFTEAALNYLTRKNKGEQIKIEPISFEKVFPLYGAIDIRNSSVERNHAIQLDLLEQLNLAATIIEKAKTTFGYPLLDEVLFRIGKYSHAVSNILFAEEEQAIYYFIGEEMVQLLTHLKVVIPSLAKDVENYLLTVDSPVKMVYHHRKDYEESITRINNAVARFIDSEQKSAQDIFPHYFERFVTDGVDFNIYIGQSITPQKTFDEFYLKNLKIWQLTTLAKAAQLTHRLEKELSLPLQTTQLILAHSQPISISFRTAERKFDVDGAYNIRYEIIKKRIDKVHIKDSNERLTQPGMIAVVYSQPKEGQEYLEYIEYLQNAGLLKADIEKMDLEDLQGVSGLKGLRVAVNVSADWNFSEKTSLMNFSKERILQ